MGTWGHGTFENDGASDWVYELEKARDLSVIEAALDAVIGAADFLESSDCCNALAAAEVVAALRGKPSAELPPEVTAWVSGRKAAPLPLVTKSMSAVVRILGDSELKELWAESGEVGDWESSVHDLKRRLG